MYLKLKCRCEHEKPKAADACVAEVIGETNSEHFFVASQDGDLRKKFKEVSKPLLFTYIFPLFQYGCFIMFVFGKYHIR